ncbi:MAG TPA: NrfD/PsrC family molybdoenzyme membrane anchor subunit [Isosphaeraceae bacterium]
MNRFVVGPDWGWAIVIYFYLGGIAAGAYAVASMVGLWGDEDDRRAVRVAHYLAFPLVSLCGLLLIVDLNRPERFWHMMIQSQTGRPMLKWWSPMSAGSWGLSAFGAFSFASFLGALAEDRRWPMARWAVRAARLRRGPLGKLFGMAGTLTAFFLGAYTGTLLSATNQPVWADTAWLSPLFLASALATGVAAMTLLERWFLRDTPAAAHRRLGRVETWSVAMEGVLLVVFAGSLGRLAPEAFLRWPGLLIPAVVVPASLILPLAARRLRGRWAPIVAAASVLAGGLALRYAVVGMPGPLLLGS